MNKVITYSLFLLAILASCQTSKDDLVIEENDTKLILENGILLFAEKPFSGVLESHYDSKNLKSQISYVQGRKEGLEIIWYINETVASKRFYSKGLKTGTHKAWWENGNQKFIYQFNDEGEYDGNVKEWYKSGALFKDFNYKNKAEVGSQKLWYETGKIKANYEVINGEQFGLIGLKKCYQVTVGSNDVK